MLASYLDELARLSSLLEGAAHLVRGEVEGGVARSDVLLDRLDARAVALLQSLDCLEAHLRRAIEKRREGLRPLLCSEAATAVRGHIPVPSQPKLCSHT